MKHIIAATLGLNIADLGDYRYQPTRTTRPIYAIGNIYVAAGHKPPKDNVGAKWEEHQDQFWTNGQTTVWVAKAI
jgi:hypothetical protein